MGSQIPPPATKPLPLRTARYTALALAWAWGVIGGSVGLNALVKSNQQQSRLRKLVPPPTVVVVDVDDVFRAGAVLTTICALVATLCTLFALLHFLPYSHSLYPSRGTLLLESLLLGFCAVWLFASLVPFTVFFATRSASVRAFIDGIELSPRIIKIAEQALGATSVYNKIGYLRLVAILPWITLLFTTIASIVLFLASSRARRTQHTDTATSASDNQADQTAEKPYDTEKTGV